METFEFAFDPRYKGLLRVIGVKPSNALVTLTDDDRLQVQFGRWKVDTPISNISCYQVTEDYKWFKAIGARGSFVDRGATFGTNTRKGVCLEFHKPIRALVPGEGMNHPGLTLTLADIEGFLEALRRRGVESTK